MKEHLILRVIAKLTIPLILLFALYVQFHGDYGPGGGFQAGVIFAAAGILYGLIFGLNKIESVVSGKTLTICAASGVLIYAITGLIALLYGANFLDYNVLAEDAHKGQHIGILLIEFGVGITVASVMLQFFYLFTRS